jgi:hypothetical protein
VAKAKTRKPSASQDQRLDLRFTGGTTHGNKQSEHVRAGSDLRD